MRSDKARVLGIPVSQTGVGDIPGLFSAKPMNESMLITFVNPQACALSLRYPDYLPVLEGFDIVACDGIGMVKAARASGLQEIQRESFDFTSLAGAVFRSAVMSDLSIGLVGSEPGVSEQAAAVLKQKYTDLQVIACYSGYGHGPVDARQFFTENQTDLVICGMGAPLQEKFFVQLVADGWHGIGFTCGGFLDQVIVGEAYYPIWIDRLNIRFLYRLFKEPTRLWRRYLVDYQVFLWRYSQLQWKRLKSRIGTSKKPGKSL